ncbi:hypothetical protein BC829DRAFT_395923 [Chytridium lagenaria]|nr:hypothetical protein BC829DRAFT_395923 [Chytridium lagenaria]
MMQKVIEVFLDKLDEFQGVFQQFSVDDKGYTLLGCFGLPPYSNGTCSINCVKAAKAFVKAAEKIEGQDRNNFVVSIATGDILFTTLGVDDRKEAGLLGEVFNTAARLLGTQSEECRIIIEPRTYALVKQICKCRDLGRVKVKGKNKSLQIWGISEDMDSNTSVQMEKGIIGNTQEWQRVKAGFDEWILDRDKKHIVLIQGASGIGKTSLLMHLQSYMRNRYVMHCYARGADLDQTIRFVGNLLDKVNEDRSYLNLVLEWLFPGSVNDDASVKEVWDSKMSILASLVGKILLNVVEEDRIAIILDDFQWIDSGSIEAIVNVCVCLYIFSRPLENGRAIENIALDQTVELTGASPADIKAYIIKSLNVRSVEDELCVSIHKKTGGNLLQLDTLISRMKEHHFDTKGRARKNLCMDAGFWSAQSFENILSEKVESIIIAQMDGCLNPRPLFSLVDVVFLLNDQNLTVTKVREIVLSEDTYGFIAKDPSLSADDLFESTSFRHITIRNAIYESISMASRQTMHLQMAERYEMIKGEAERKAAMPQTCYHYWRSGCVPKLIYWNVQFGISLMFDGLLYESTCTLKEICEFIEKSEIVNNGFGHQSFGCSFEGEAFGILAWSSLNILTIQENSAVRDYGLESSFSGLAEHCQRSDIANVEIANSVWCIVEKDAKGQERCKEHYVYFSRYKKTPSLQYAMAGLMGSFIFDPEIERHKMVSIMAILLVLLLDDRGRVLMRSRALNGLGRKITLRSTECRKFLEEETIASISTRMRIISPCIYDEFRWSLKSKGFLILPNFLLGQVHDTLGDTMPLIKEMAVKSPVWTMGLASYILIESFLLNRLDNATLAYSVFEELHTRVSGPQFFMVGSTPTLARLIMVLLSRTHAVEPVCSRPELVSEASSVGRAFFVAIYLLWIASGGRSLRNIAPLLARASKWLFERLAISTMGRCGYWLTFAAEAMVVGDFAKEKGMGDLMGLGGITCATIGLMLEEEEGRIWRRRAADIFRQMRADMLVIWVEGRI